MFREHERNPHSFAQNHTIFKTQTELVVCVSKNIKIQGNKNRGVTRSDCTKEKGILPES